MVGVANKTLSNHQSGSKKMSMKTKVKKSKSKQGKDIKGKRWIARENIKYAEFLLKHHRDFETEYQRRTKKVYSRLAQVVQDKTVRQCKSHHQKMMIKFDQEILNIIRYYLPMQEELIGMAMEEVSTNSSSNSSDQSDDIDSKISPSEINIKQDDESVGIFIDWAFWDRHTHR